MNVKLWQIAAFVLVVLAGTWWSFPYGRNLAQLYLDSGDIMKARDILARSMAETEPDFATLVEAARLHQRLGEIGEAIEIMQRAVALKPRNLTGLATLADYYTWDLDLAEAATVRERMAAVRPDPETWNNLLNYYRYAGLTDRETDAVARLVELRHSDDTADLPPLVRAMIPDLDDLARRHLEQGAAPDPEADYLLRRLFGIREQYERLLADNPEAVRLPQFATWVQELFVGTGRTDMGREFAERLDRAAGGHDGRLALATVLRWNGLSAEALPVLRDLLRTAPDDETLLAEMAATGRAAKDMGAASRALEVLSSRHPNRTDLRRELADVYMADKKYGRAMTLLKDLIRTTGDAAANVKAMLRAALYSDDKTAMTEVLDESAKYNLSDPEVLRERAEVHLALEQYAQGYQVLRALVESPAGTDRDLARMLDAAGASGDQKLLAQGLELAARKRPGDPAILRQAAQSVAGAGDGAGAFALMERIPARDRTRDDALAMLDYAGAGAKAGLVRKAVKALVSAYPEDLAVADQTATVASWVLSPAETYPLAQRAAVLSGGEKGRVDRMVQLASFANDVPLLVKAAKEARRLRPDDADYVFTEADALAAEGKGRELSRLVAAHVNKTDPAGLRKWAGYAEASGNNEQAYQLYKALHERFPKDAAARDGLLRNAEYSGHYDTAAGLLAELSDAAPTNFDLAKRAGAAFAAAGISDRAVTYYQRASALRPDDKETRLALLEAATFGGDPAKAVEYYEALGRERALGDEEQLALAEAYAGLNRNKEALSLVAKYRRASPLPVRPGLLLARLYTATGETGQAASVLKRLHARAEGDPDLLRQVGSEALYAGATGLAGRVFRDLARVSPDDATALKGLAIVYGDQGEYERGIRQFKGYLQRFPEDADARFRLAEYYLAEDRPRLAAAEFDRARKLLKAGKRATQAGIK